MGGQQWKWRNKSKKCPSHHALRERAEMRILMTLNIWCISVVPLALISCLKGNIMIIIWLLIPVVLQTWLSCSTVECSDLHAYYIPHCKSINPCSDLFSKVLGACFYGSEMKLPTVCWQSLKTMSFGISLKAQWLRICLLRQRMLLWSLVRELRSRVCVVCVCVCVCKHTRVVSDSLWVHWL